MPKHKYEIEMDGEAVVAISFGDLVAARTFLAAVAAFVAVDPSEVDANDIINPIKNHSKSFYIAGRDEEATRRIREE